MRFFFALEDGTTVGNTNGQELEDAVQASEIADKLARHLVDEDPRLAEKGYSVVVRDETGEQVYKIRLDESAAGTIF